MRSDAPAYACGEENGYRRLFYAFYFTYEHGGKVFGYSEVLEDIHCTDFEHTVVLHGATAHLFVHPNL